MPGSSTMCTAKILARSLAAVLRMPNSRGNTGDLISLARDALPRSILPHVLKISQLRGPTSGGVPIESEGLRLRRKSATIRNDWNTVEIVVNNSEGSTHIVNDRSTQTATILEKRTMTKWVPLKRVTLRAARRR